MLHVLSGAAWIGVDVVVAVLVAAGAFGGPATQGLAYQALGTFIVWPMLVSGLVCLATGLVLGLATKWGLLRYWWVAVKLAMNLALCATILAALQPGMPALRAHGEALSAGVPSVFDTANLIFPPTVSLTALSLATILSIYKPWGRLKGRRA